jgi:hypothetical protein
LPKRPKRGNQDPAGFQVFLVQLEHLTGLLSGQIIALGLQEDLSHAVVFGNRFCLGVDLGPRHSLDLGGLLGFGQCRRQSDRQQQRQANGRGQQALQAGSGEARGKGVHGKLRCLVKA